MYTSQSLGSFIQQRYISFGPSCLSAEILKACNLRFCTFGFDWFRSGSFHHSLFFKLDLKDFLKFHVNNLSAPLRQRSNPEQQDNKTSEVEGLKQVYGYNVLYNPHKNYNKYSFDYYERSFRRLTLRLDSNSPEFKSPIFLMADYLNKAHYVHFNNTGEAAAYLSYNCLLKYNYTPSIKIIRFKLVEDEDLCSLPLSFKKSEHHTEYIVPLSYKIDASTEMRRLFYKSLFEIFA